MAEMSYIIKSTYSSSLDTLKNTSYDKENRVYMCQSDMEVDSDIEFINDTELEQFKCIIKREENKLGEKLGDTSIKLTKNRKLILKSIKEDNSITIAQLAQILNISTTAIENNLKYLKENKLIKRVGSDNAGSWEIINEK